MPSDAYLAALDADLDRLKRGERYWQSKIAWCRQDIRAFADDPERVAVSELELETAIKRRDEFKEKHDLRYAQLMLMSQGNFAQIRGVLARVFGSDSGIEIFSRTDPDLLEGDQMLFGPGDDAPPQGAPK